MSLKKPNFKPISLEQIQEALSESEQNLFLKGSKFLFEKKRATTSGVKGEKSPKSERDTK